jgi:hypothetical protein
VLSPCQGLQQVQRRLQPSKPPHQNQPRRNLATHDHKPLPCGSTTVEQSALLHAAPAETHGSSGKVQKPGHQLT